jgi:hypothetical protein
MSYYEGDGMSTRGKILTALFCLFVSAVIIFGIKEIQAQTRKNEREYLEKVPFRPGMRVRHRADGRFGIVTEVYYMGGIRVSFPTALGESPYAERWYQPYELEVAP